jgi:hypothetical protein
MAKKYSNKLEKDDKVMGVDETVRRYQTEGKPVTKKTDLEECPEGAECPEDSSSIHNVEGINFKKQTLGTECIGPGYQISRHPPDRTVHGTLVKYERGGIGYGR